jgi:hypothetical protein
MTRYQIGPEPRPSSSHRRHAVGDCGGRSLRRGNRHRAPPTSERAASGSARSGDWPQTGWVGPPLLQALLLRRSGPNRQGRPFRLPGLFSEPPGPALALAVHLQVCAGRAPRPRRRPRPGRALVHRSVRRPVGGGVWALPDALAPGRWKLLPKRLERHRGRRDLREDPLCLTLPALRRLFVAAQAGEVGQGDVDRWLVE